MFDVNVNHGVVLKHPGYFGKSTKSAAWGKNSVFCFIQAKGEVLDYFAK